MADEHGPPEGHLQTATPAGADPNAGAGSPQTSAASGTPVSGPEVDLDKIDLTQIPAFRRVQSELDRQVAAERAERERLARELEAVKAHQQQRALADIEHLDPAEQAARYRQMLADQQAQAQRQAEQQRYANEIGSLLQAGGLTWQSPEVVSALSGFSEPNAAAVAAVSRAVVHAASAKTRAAELAAAKAAEDARIAATKAAQRAEVAEIAASGAAATSTATGKAPPADGRGELVNTFRTRWKGLIGKGNDQAVMRFKQDLRKAGLTFDDIGY